MERRHARVVKIGSVPVGGGYPVAVQSMLSARPDDLEANLRQAVELADAGCDIVRVAVPTARQLPLIAALKEATRMPVVADIQFDYRLAVESAAAGADKIRINPGNIGALDRVRAVVAACAQRSLPIRIGVNSGSLEREILAKYGRPCADALVESALLNMRLLERFDFDNYLVAIKSSSVGETIECYRRVAALCDCPLHLGVTEAGGERMGMLKSAAAMGSLLCDGIGDTIRVSLTADPVREVYAARDILKAVDRHEDGVQVVSCPTCGRCKNDLVALVEALEPRLANCRKRIKVAVMGCAVNGPGEARDADIGLAGGDGCYLLFKKGETIRKIAAKDALDELLQEIDAL